MQSNDKDLVLTDEQILALLEAEAPSKDKVC